MKKLIFIFVLFSFTLSGCSDYQKLLKSTDNSLKYKKAVEYYNSEEYVKASTLFEELLPIYRGTSKAETISYYISYCSYGQGDYISAGYYFRNFLKTFPDSPYSEESLYMSAYCYYLESPNARLDQTPTASAIDAFQLYINRYPNSTRIPKCNDYIDELQDKLVFKSYLSAKGYFDREHYPSAIIALQNSLKDYPGSSYREDLMFMLLDSKYELAYKSVVSKKRERYNNAKEEYYSFVDEYPKSKHLKQAEKMMEDIESYLGKFNTNN
ncbi:outer membrane protein assembly factor BamD [Ancylomarina longa]|uniref:Outer membrane protein assembly factor BamD n=1 Tax=Ancylomarina longa TaxID=2487017 RepID=A0A434AZ03_9BACT|nr:outer membrane protein assembly factor BamD [Ancylomarina longa]RUT79726.1 outer membrane protein assembly factor BamD [Ancylomarina longa]